MTSPTTDSQPSTILLVDDDLDIHNLVKHAMKKEGHEVVSAYNGKDGLKKAEKTHPDLIISDIMMPQMDGWKFFTHLRTSPPFALTPFIFLTSLDSAQDRIRGFQLGADDYLPKPFHPQELAIRVANALERKRRIDQSTRVINKTSSGTHLKEEYKGMGGQLDDIGISSVLTLLSMDRKTGLLTIVQTSREDETDRLTAFIRRGKIIQARLENNPHHTNVDAICKIFDWSSGYFKFRPQEVDNVADEIGITTDSILLEAARRLDESARS